MDRFITIILYPFSLIYLTITGIRNGLFNLGILKEKEFNTPVINIGNLTVGGTGKTPHTEYIIRLLKNERRISVLSRGYGRKTKGFLEVFTDSIPIDVGDEPLQIKQKFPDIHVNVCEDRVKGIERIIKEQNPEVIILDDAYQHRHVKPSLSILLCDYNRPFYNDYVIPAGRLREHWSGRKRADIIIVSKCPSDLTKNEADKIRKRIKPFDHQSVYFSTISYGEPKSLSGKSFIKEKNVNLVTGIANPKPLLEHLTKFFKINKHIKFPDHHNFSDSDIKRIKKLIRKQPVITTEKDSVRLVTQIDDIKLRDRISYVPIEVRILFGKQNDLIDKVFI